MWRQLASAVTGSISQTPLDEMITLVQENKGPIGTFRGVRVVKFKDVGDIRQQLSIAAGPSSTLNPAATPFIPARTPPQTNGAELSVDVTSDEANEENATQIAAEEEDTEPPKEVDVAAIIESIGTNFTGPSADTLAKQDDAAKTLVFYYRRLVTNRAKRIAEPRLGLPKTRQDQFEVFALAAESIDWPQKSLYRPIFLGALPHLLTCLEYTWSIVMEEKKKVKRQARPSEKHQGIEGLMERQTKLRYVYDRLERITALLTDAGHDFSAMIKRIKALQTSLDASSSFHKGRDLKKLGVHLASVRAIVDELPQAKEELAFDLSMASAWRRYVEERQKPKVEKPVLNTDDLDGIF